MSITTKTGDSGQTGLFGGKRVSKGCNDIEAIGDVDELNSMIGVVRSSVETQCIASLQDIDQILEYIQNCCFMIGAQIASIDFQKEERRKKKEVSSNKKPLSLIRKSDTQKLEKQIKKLEKQLPELHHFILPSGHPVASQLFLTRAVCRRAERSIVRLDKTELSDVLKFINRLSDLLFLLARSVNQSENKKETIWSR